MVLSSAVRIVQQTPTDLTVILSAQRVENAIGFVIALLVLGFGTLYLLSQKRKIAATLLAVICIIVLIQTVLSWSDQTVIRFSKVQNTLTIHQPGVFGANLEEYPLNLVQAAVIDAGGDATKRLDIVLGSGQTIYVGNYDNRDGYEAAQVAITRFLQGPNS